jgi:hypothetical protein
MFVAALLTGCTAGVPADPAHVYPGGYTRLSETGLYADFEAREIAPDLEAFTPRFTLWSDGAVKHRWISLPPGAVVDTTDPDRWRFPVGTRLFKEFAAPDGRKLETRLVERIDDTGDPDRDFWLGAFAWLDDESDAVFVPDGQPNTRSTEHDIPAEDTCHSCHNGEPGRSLGFSELQLSGPGDGLRLADLVARGLTSGPPASSHHAVDDDAVAAAGLGYLHANCGHCHNPEGSARPDTDLDLRIRATDATLADTGAYRTAIGHPLWRFKADGLSDRIAPGAPDTSGIVYRMSRRGPRLGMPPVGTEVVDPQGVDAVRAWVASLSP